MKVAIVGAGPSGLACAIELERQGIYPDIFERKSKAGSEMPMANILLNVFGQPRRNQLRHLNEDLGLGIEPLARLCRAVIHTRKRSVTVKGHLGYLLERGQGERCLEVQLASRLRGVINFNTAADIDKLSESYDHVVVAAGDQAFARSRELWRTAIRFQVKGAIILGDYDPQEASLFLDTGCAGHGFGNLAPFSRERAMLALAVPDCSREEINTNWQKFMEWLKLDPKIVECFEISTDCGLTTRQKSGNVLLVGNSGGFTESVLIQGLTTGMASGFLAARAIARGLDYEKLVRPLLAPARRLLAFREALNRLDNNGIDLLVRTIAMPGVKQAVFNTGIDVFGLVHPLVRRLAGSPRHLLRPAARKRGN